MSTFKKFSILFVLLLGILDASAQATYSYTIERDQSCNSVTFSINTDDPNPPAVKWDFGDGSPVVSASGTESVTHEFPGTSNYPAVSYTTKLLDAAGVELSSKGVLIYPSNLFASAYMLYLPERKWLPSQSGHFFRVRLRGFNDPNASTTTYHYSWTVKDASGATVFSETYTHGSFWHITIPEEGIHTVEVSVLDTRTNCVVKTITETLTVTGYTIGNGEFYTSCGYYPTIDRSIPVLDNNTNNRKYDVHWDMGDGSTVWEKDYPHGHWRYQYYSAGLKELKAYSATGELLAMAKIYVDDVHSFISSTDWSWNIDRATNELHLSVDGISSDPYKDYDWNLLPANIGIEGNTVENPETDAVYNLTNYGPYYGRISTALVVRYGMSNNSVTCGYKEKDIDNIPLIECDFESSCTPGVLEQVSIPGVDNYQVFRYLKNTTSACGERVSIADIKEGENVLESYGAYAQEQGANEEDYGWVYVPNTVTNPVISYKEIYQVTDDRAACYIQRQFPECNTTITSSISNCSEVSLSYTSACDFSAGVQWDFGDNQTSSESSPTHVYSTPGTYTVKLEHPTTGELYASQEVVVQAATYDASFNHSSSADKSLTLVRANTPGPGEVSNWHFESLTDGVTAPSSVLGASSTTTLVLPSYGVYRITHEVVGPNGCSSETYKIIQLLEPGCSWNENSTCTSAGIFTSYTIPGHMDISPRGGSSYGLHGGSTYTLNRVLCWRHNGVEWGHVFDLTDRRSVNSYPTLNATSGPCHAEIVVELKDEAGNLCYAYHEAWNYAELNWMSLDLSLDGMDLTVASGAGSNLHARSMAVFDVETGEKVVDLVMNDQGESSHTFLASGHYRIRVEGVIHGCTRVMEEDFYVLCNPEITVNQACRSISLSYVSTGCVVTDPNWIFGDGSTSTEDSPTHTYTESATTTDYTIELRDGTTVLATQVVTIPGALDAGLVWQQNAECKPNGNTGPWRIDFTLYNTNADYLYTISLAKEGEAEVILPEGQLYADVTSQGDYTVKLTISDPASGCEKVLEEVVKVYSNNILVEGANMGAHCMEYSFHWQYYTNGLITLENPTWSIVRLDAAGNELQTIDWGDGLLSSYDFTPRADKPGLGNGRYHVYIRDGEEMCQYGMWDVKVGDLTDLDFTAEETCQNGVEVSVVDYYGWDASWGHTAPHNYELDFGDGTVISGQDVKALNTHGYDQGGTYTMTLKASSYGTCENEVSKTITVTGDVYPDELEVCNFSFNPAGWSTSIELIENTGEGLDQVKLSLTFNDMVTSFYDVSVYAVEFDGRTYIPSAGNMSITVDYEACKLYEPVFKVKVLDRANCTGCLIDLPGSLSLEPSSVISIVTAENCEEVTLSYERTCGPGVITPMWFLLDNGTETLLSTEASFTHNFGGVGSYAIELRDGSTPGFTPISKTVEVTALRPEAKTFSSEVSCGNAFTVSVDNPSAAQSYSWTIGDLTVPGQTTMLPFTTQGNHEITLRTISTATGCSAVHTGSAFADNGPLYSIGYEVGACGAVNFTVESNCVAGSIAPVWSFGDGSSGSGYAVSHTYTRNGTYTVTLSDENGTFYYPDFVQVMISDLPSASSSTSSGCDADLDYSVSDVQVGYNYTWDFGDGSQSTDPNGTHTYASFGSYEVSLSVEHAGCTVVYAHTVQVGPVEATFTLTEEQCSDGEIAPRDVPVSGVTGYAWTFGDLPEVYTERYPEVLYPLGVDESSKVVPVKLTVYSENNGESCVSEQTKQVTLYHPVNAEFTLEALDNQGHVKLSALDPEHTSSYTATFEEGAVHTGVSPTTEIHHTFTSTGVKTVRLEVSNGPCLAVYSIERLIHVPEVHIESDPEDYICGSGSVTLEAVLSGHDEGLTYHYRWLRGLDIVGGDSKTVTVSEGGSYGLQVFTDGPNPIGLYTYKVVEIYPLPDGLTASNIVGESCAGLADGSCSISIPNYLSTAGYTVNGGEVQNDATLNLTGLSSGVKYYRIAYANRPECSVVVEVDVPFTGPSVSTSMEWATCGHPTGALEASVSGGETPYSYAWYRSGDLTTSLGSGARLENQLPGTYTLVVTDNSGCEVRKEHLRIKSSELISRLATTDLSTCSNGGAVTVEPLVHYSHAPEEEVTGLTYSWKQEGLVVSTDEQPSLPPGKYTLEVHDPVKDCYGEYSFEVASLNPLIVEITQEDIYCIGDQAELMAISKGGSGVYSYAWTGTSVNGPRFKGAEADQTYEVTVSDDHGCVTSVSRTVVYVAPPLSDVSVEMDHCEVSMTVTGGHAPYNFKWYQQLPIERVEDRTPPFDSEGNPQEDVLDFEALEKVITIEKVLMHEHGGLSTSELMSGTYELVVTDAEGCTHVLENVEIIREEDETFPDFSFVFTGIEPDTTPEPKPEYDEFIVNKLAEAKQSMSRQLDKCLSNAEYNLTTYLMQNCFDVDQFSDELTVTHDFDAHHYTLYYYDRAGKLTQTVPPEGVDLLSLEEIGAIQTYREDPNNTAPSKLYPAHSLNTKYDYNSLGQLVHQETPDGGSSYFHYDVHNRLRFSQNAEQARTGKFSYVKYDELGRTIEAGESSQTGLVFGDDLSPEEKTMNATLSNTVDYPQTENKEITHTVYTVPASVTYGERTQRHLQNRISHVYKDEDGDLSTTEDQHYSYYSYDAHGNVEWLVQEDPVLGRNSVEYVYDLVNGNVLEVAYNKYRNDKFYHRYSYDANNRLLSVLTSRDGEVWDEDVRQEYYRHGPMKRMEIGEDEIQGMDYVYTIQGWTKALNAPDLDPLHDPGSDGTGNSIQDVFGMSLNYYAGDYKSGTSFLSGVDDFNPAEVKSLYSGNIAKWSSRTLTGEEGTDQLTARTFGYDHLNRIKSSAYHEYNGTTQSWAGGNDKYRTEYAYDANGNLETLKRYDQNAALMDELHYLYKGQNSMSDTKTGNQLMSVTDVTEESYTKVDGQGDLMGTHVYEYDAIGNLIKDTGKEWLKNNTTGNYEAHDVVLDIKWNVSGKVEEVAKTITNSSGVREELIRFHYDAMGNRVSKEVNHDVSIAEVDTKTTYYVRDASGNPMGVYERRNESLENDPEGYAYEAVFELVEHSIYGGSRVGLDQERKEVYRQKYTVSEEVALPRQLDGLHRQQSLNTLYAASNRSTGVNGGVIADASLHQITTDEAGVDQVTLQQNILGRVSEGVAVVENSEGELLFTAVLAGSYLGSQDACLIYDKTGQLMQGVELIGSQSAQVKPIAVKLGGANRYALVTLNDQNKPVYHVIDMDATGYGSAEDKRGAVVQANAVITEESGVYGKHLTGVEDGIGEQSVLYQTRYVAPSSETEIGKTEVLAYVFDEAGGVEVERMAAFGSRDSRGEGELQLGANGTELVYYNRKDYIGGFAYQKGMLHVMHLGSDKSSIEGKPLQLTTGEGGTIGTGHVSFKKDGKGLYYSQRSLYKAGTEQGYAKLWDYELLTESIFPVEEGEAHLYGSVRQNGSGEYYILRSAAPAMEVDKLNEDGTLSALAAGTSSTAYSWASSLPGEVYKVQPEDTQLNYQRIAGSKSYELKDHLGNVRAVVSDKRFAVIENNTLNNTADLLSYSDVYPFGMEMPGRSMSGEYRYGVGGHEKDDELRGEGNHLSFGNYGYDPRLGRRWNIDPMYFKIPGISPYSYCVNDPVLFIDPDGNIPFPLLEKWKNRKGKTVSRKMSSPFGMRTYKGKTRMHKGVDLNMGGGEDDYGAPVSATHDGVIIKMTSYKKDKDGGGTRIYIQALDGSIQTRYMHLSGFAKDLKEGMRVSEGQVIGYVGGTAFGKKHKRKSDGTLKSGTAVHLHYELLQRGTDGELAHINPMKDGEMIDPQVLITPTTLEGELWQKLVLSHQKMHESFDSYMAKIDSYLEGTISSDELRQAGQDYTKAQRNAENAWDNYELYLEIMQDIENANSETETEEEAP